MPQKCQKPEKRKAKKVVLPQSVAVRSGLLITSSGGPIGAAGAARVPVWRYTWTTAVGYLPITALAVYFGTQLDLFSGLF